MEETFEEFYNAACAEFGCDKFTIKPIVVTDENIEKFNKESSSELTKRDFELYKAVWLLENKCPKCGSELGGLFGSFQWGLVHGVGNCSECGTLFRLYHYIGNSRTPIRAYALEGF